MRSSGSRFFIVGILAVFMFIPLFFAGQVINERANYSDSTAQSLGREWGGSQVLRGPQLILPVREIQDRTFTVAITDPDTGEQLRDPSSGAGRERVVTRRVDVTKDSIRLLPQVFDAALDTTTNVRKRGIFKVPVYRANLDLNFDYDLSQIDDLLTGDERVLWDKAELTFGITSNRALRGAVSLGIDGRDYKLNPWSNDRDSGVASVVGDPREHTKYVLSMGFQGAEQVQIAPAGRTSVVKITSDWPHPSFNGAFLPDNSTISEDGFSATWTVPHLARAVPEAARRSLLADVGQEAFGFRFFQPNDFYQKAYRAARYGILFIGLTFLTVLLIEGARDKPTHPVQYILIGLVQSMFVVLMVAYAEQIGFNAAYLTASGAVVALLTLYGWVGLKLGKRSLILAVMLATLYAVLFMILRSADFALIAGATLLFAALAGTMWATRNEDWYGPEKAKRAGGGWLARRSTSAVTEQSD